MGCVYNRGTKKKPNYWIKWKDPDGKIRYRKIGKDRQLARDVLAKIEGDIARGRYGLPDESKPKDEPTFAELAVPWVEGRAETHRSARDDKSRMKNHLLPFFGEMRLAEIDVGCVKNFIRSMREKQVGSRRKKQDRSRPNEQTESKREKLSPTTIRLTLRLASRFFNEMIEQKEVTTNPVAQLDRATRRTLRPTHDPRKTPFLRKKEDVRRLFLELNPPYRQMFALGVFGGLRTSEIRSIQRADISLQQRRIHVQRSVGGPVKDDESRVVPILDSLFPVLEDWLAQNECRGSELVFPPTTGRGRYIREHTLYRNLRKALVSAGLPKELTWYQCTRHSFASHWILDGRPIATLREILGHSSVLVTERYCHLAPDMFGQADYEAISLDLTDKGPSKAKEGPASYAGVTLRVVG